MQNILWRQVKNAFRIGGGGGVEFCSYKIVMWVVWGENKKKDKLAKSDYLFAWNSSPIYNFAKDMLLLITIKRVYIWLL